MPCYTCAVKKPLGETIRMLAPLISMAVLILILVVLQVRWTGEVSRVQRRDSQIRLDEKLESFARDFDREITRLYYSFRIQSSGTSTLDLQGLSAEVANRNTHWLETSTYPQLMESIWLLTSDPAGPYRFDEVEGGFESAEWDPALEKLRHHLASWLEKATPREMRDQKILLSPDPLAILTVWESPAVCSPSRERTGGDVWNCLVELIDPVVIREQMMPDLTRRYFFLQGRPEFYLSIAGKTTGSPLLYQSAPDLFPADGQCDASTEIWRLRKEDLVLAPGSWIPEPPLPPLPPPPPPIPGGGEQLPETVSDTNTAAESPPELSPLQQMNSEAGSGHFNLLARHYSGSLDRVAAAERRNELALSLGVLLLLATSIILLYLSARQARNTARRQREFVAGVSHELRTPLAVICAGAENLADGVPGRDENSVREYGKLIHNEGRRLTGMVEDLLEYSAIGSGRRKYLAREIDPSQLVRQAIEQSEASIREAGMELEATIPDKLPLIVGDMEALSRALLNLVNNAVRHANDGGWIGIEMALSPEGREIQISIADRGRGITRKDLRRIFLPFERGESTVRRQVRGAGIGLSLVRHIIENHQGRVTVESEVNRGSRFTLHIPAAGRPVKDN